MSMPDIIPNKDHDRPHVAVSLEHFYYSDWIWSFQRPQKLDSLCACFDRETFAPKTGKDNSNNDIRLSFMSGVQQGRGIENMKGYYSFNIDWRDVQANRRCFYLYFESTPRDKLINIPEIKLGLHEDCFDVFPSFPSEGTTFNLSSALATRMDLECSKHESSYVFRTDPNNAYPPFSDHREAWSFFLRHVRDRETRKTLLLMQRPRRPETS
jgi:hypothetical protein